ncbi:MAG: deoxyribose-phosphate aldolase [Planctomycetota bacterium]
MPNATTAPRSAARVAEMLDHAILHPTVGSAAMRREIEALRHWPIASFCVKPSHVAEAVGLVEGSVPAIGTVIGFPHGTTTAAVKAAEAREALASGAAEIDMVVNVGAVLGGEWDTVRADIAAVLGACRGDGGLLKVIFETDYVTEDADKRRLCELCGELGVDFVKTSTGFGYVKRPDGTVGYTGATAADVTLMRQASPPSVGVKPSGGVRTLDHVLAFAALGATRMGTTSTPAIMDAAIDRFGPGGLDASAHKPAATAPGGGGGQHEY